MTPSTRGRRGEPVTARSPGVPVCAPEASLSLGHDQMTLQSRWKVTAAARSPPLSLRAPPPDLKGSHQALGLGGHTAARGSPNWLCSLLSPCSLCTEAPFLDRAGPGQPLGSGRSPGTNGGRPNYSGHHTPPLRSYGPVSSAAAPRARLAPVSYRCPQGKSEQEPFTVTLALSACLN